MTPACKTLLVSIVNGAKYIDCSLSDNPFNDCRSRSTIGPQIKGLATTFVVTLKCGKLYGTRAKDFSKAI